MSDAVFRTAREATEQAETPKPDTSTNTVETHAPELLATYAEDIGNPYTADYYDLKNVWDSEESLKNELTEIEDYLKLQIKRGKLDNSTRAADKYLKDLERKAGTNPYESANKRITKVLAYLDFQRIVNS